MTVTEKVCQLRERVAELITEARFRTWFADKAEFVVLDDVVEISAKNRFVGDWIATHYLKQVAAAVEEVFGRAQQVRIRVPREKSAAASAAAPSTPPAPAPARPGGASRNGRLALRHELEDFIVGPNNELAYNTVRRALTDFSAAMRPLVIHGGVGLGKTHLLQGFCNALSREHPLLSWKYVSGEEFTNEFVAAVRNGHDAAFRARFRQIDVLVVDDIHFLENKKATQAEFLHTFNAIDAAGKAIILSSDRHPRKLAALGAPLCDRLASGTEVEVLPPDVATRREIFRALGEAKRKPLPDDVVEVVANAVRTNVRALEGVFYKLVALASLARAPIGRAMALRALEEAGVEAEDAPTLARIERAVAARFGTTRAALHSPARDRTVSAARSVAMYLIRKHLQLSLPQIGDQMGGKNHTTVLIASRRIEKALAANEKLQWKTPGGPVDAPAAEIVSSLEAALGLGAASID